MAYRYFIQTTTSFEYSMGAEGEHQLLVHFDWTSPVSNKVMNSMIVPVSYINREQTEFYKTAERIMKSEADIKHYVATEMARVLRLEIEAGGGINWDAIAKQKFEEALSIKYTFTDVYVDLDQDYQTGTP